MEDTHGIIIVFVVVVVGVLAAGYIAGYLESKTAS